MNEEGAPDVNVQDFINKVPVLGICYGAQLTAKQFGGVVAKSNKREYGRAILQRKKEDVLLNTVSEETQVWMSHADTILEMPEGFELLATTESIPVAAFKKSANGRDPLPTCTPIAIRCTIPSRSLSFQRRKKSMKNFLVNICGCSQDWTPAHFITDTVADPEKADR